MLKNIAIGSDPWAGQLHAFLSDLLQKRGHTVTEVNQVDTQRVPYYEVAKRVALEVSRSKDTVGIVLCGTGMGVSMVANKFPGISCALCENTLAAHRSRIFNNANVLAMGQLLTTNYIAEEIVTTFLNTDFRQGVETERGDEICTWHKAVAEMEKRLFVDNWQDQA